MAGTFSLNLARICKKHNVNMRDFVRKIALEAFKRVIEKSPVDTGRFRANWGVKIGSAYAGYNEDARDTTPVGDRSGPTCAKAEWDTLRWNAEGAITLSNNTVYARPLEYGHSKIQAPGGMVRLSIAEIQVWANSAANVTGGN